MQAQGGARGKRACREGAGHAEVLLRVCSVMACPFQGSAIVTRTLGHLGTPFHGRRTNFSDRGRPSFACVAAWILIARLVWLLLGKLLGWPWCGGSGNSQTASFSNRWDDLPLTLGACFIQLGQAFPPAPDWLQRAWLEQRQPAPGHSAYPCVAWRS